MTIEEQLTYLAKGTVEIIRDTELRAKLEKSAKTRKPLRVKLGADPTAPDIHLGHTVVIRKLRAFQELGHTAIFLVGDFTGMIGDPSGKSATRPQLTRDEINANAETYKQQIFKLLDPEKTVIEFNSHWMDTLGSAGFLRLSSHVTVRQILERDDFQQRLEANRPLALHEVMYPLVMAYDSVALEADVELGGTDQKFNLLMGRNLQREYGQESQIAMITPLLEGTDGVQKMSKSLGNYIGINEPPQEIFGKVMSISDELMWRYYELCTDLSLPEIERLKTSERNPRDTKVELAKKIVADFYSEAAGRQAEEQFNLMFRSKQAPDDVEERSVAAGPWKLPRLLVELQLAPSMAEARRLIEQGGVYVDGERAPQADLEVSAERSFLLQVGKRRFVRVRGS
ncbi:MAG: tyrosine--tRNA ligase [Acidobacteria bacterium]|nr:tyrosine--tRNA ligase [Acidobacteriota bacterium]MCA1627907.1 tyrosine--tRNA ligase [Acidobacteriota bacterium]